MPARVVIKTNGSIRLEGEYEVFDAEGNRFDLNGRTHLSLCRCGRTKDAPLCDGSHKNGVFVSEVKARILPPAKPKPQ